MGQTRMPAELGVAGKPQVQVRRRQPSQTCNSIAGKLTPTRTTRGRGGTVGDAAAGVLAALLPVQLPADVTKKAAQRLRPCYPCGTPGRDSGFDVA